MVESTDIEDLALDFTIPGYDIELRVSFIVMIRHPPFTHFSPIQPGGRDIPVTSENVEEYIQEVIDSIIGKGAQVQAKAFREGFSKVFPITDLQSFSADELAMLFGNSDEDWTVESKARLPPLRPEADSCIYSPQRGHEG